MSSAARAIYAREPRETVPPRPAVHKSWWSPRLLPAATLLLIITSTFLVVRIRSYVGLVASADRSQAAISEIHRLVSLIEYAEAGQRGFLITGDESYLAPYRDAVRNQDARVQALNKLIAGEPKQEGRTIRLESAVRNRLAIMRQTITLRSNDSAEEANAIVKLGEGRRVTDEIGAIVAALTADETMRFDDLSQQRQRLLLEIYGLSCGTIALAFLCCLIVASRQFQQIGEERFHLIANSIPQLAWMADKDGDIFWYNQRWYDYTGISPHEMKSTGWQSVHDAQVLPRVLDLWKASIDTGQPFEMEFPLRGADGTFRMFMTRVLPAKERAGRAVLWVGTNTDIEDHRGVEERLRRLYDSGIMGVFYWNEGGSIVEANDKFLEIVGYTRQDLRDEKLGWLRMTPTEYAAGDATLLEKLKTGEPVKPFEKEYLRKDGTRVHVELGIALSAAQSGQGVAFVLDITQRKEAEAKLADLNQTLDQRVRIRTAELAESNRKLEESQANLHAILDGATEVAIISTDAQGIITVFNSGAEKMLLYRAEEVIGIHTPVLFHSVPEYEARSKALSEELGRPIKDVGIFTEPPRQGDTDQREWTYIRKDQTTLDVCLSTTAIRGTTGAITGFVGIASDTTARRTLERQLWDRNLELENGVRERTENLQSALAEKTVLLKEVHHRVKNNLAVVASLLGMQADADKEGRAAGPLVESQRRVHSMALIHEHLYGTNDLTRIRFDEYAEKLTTELYMAFSSPPQIHVLVRAQPIELSIDKAIPCGLILNELISNAFKYAFPDGRRGNIEVLFAEMDGGWLNLSVADDGVGFPKGLEWSRAESLGLKIVQILSRQLDADLSVTNGTGTRFRMTFRQSDETTAHADVVDV